VKRASRRPTDEQLRDAHPELWAWYTGRYPKKDQPRRSLLMLEFVRRSSWLRLLAETTSVPIVPELSRQDPTDTTFDMVRAIKALYKPSNEVQQFRQLDADVEDLISYLKSSLSRRVGEDLIRELDERGLSGLEIFYVVPRLTRRLAGHPVTARLDAVRAADMFDAGFSWTQIAQKLYGCKDGADCSRYRERIRKAVKSLDKFFCKFGIPIPKRRHRP
jgi:hypothetical protein